MSDDENDRFENEQSLLKGNMETIPHLPSAWDQDIHDIDEDPNPHGKIFLTIIIFNEVRNVLITQEALSFLKNT